MTTLGRFGILIAVGIVLAIALAIADTTLSVEPQPGWRGRISSFLRMFVGMLIGILSGYLWWKM